LIVKVQYKDFEPGEFTDAANRSCEECIRLIEDFPWGDQRDHLKVGLTNPSVTVEDTAGNYLKLAVFYNDKYVLHYYNNKRQLFTKSFADFHDAYPYLQRFYKDEPFDTKDFRLEHTWMQKTKNHFLSDDFRYLLFGKKLAFYLLTRSGPIFLIPLVIALDFLLNDSKAHGNPVMIFFFAAFLILALLNLRIFLNYYHFAKGKLLIMSRGNDLFWFGSPDNPEQFDKKEIIKVKIHDARGGRNLFSGYAWVEIEFRQHRYLAIPNLLIDDQDLAAKLFKCSTETIRENVPSIPPSSSSPS